MKPDNVELLVGHKLAISSSYYKPNIEKDILPDYLQVVDDLTINQEYRLKRENQRLQEKNQKIILLMPSFEKKMNKFNH
jgi:hypothetical protein